MSNWQAVGADVRLAFRRLLDAPGFAAVCIATLALGIGGNTAVFTLIDRVMLERLPVTRPTELYRVGDTDACCVNSGLAGSFSLFSYDLYTRLRASAPEFSQLAAFQANTRHITIGRPEGDTPPETLVGGYVSGNFFQVFELVPAAGRLIAPADDEPGAAPAAVLSHTAWQRRFGGRADAIGRPVTLNGVPATIVGVAPQGFYGPALQPDPPEIWITLSSEPLLQPTARLLEARTSHWLYAIGRLRTGTSIGSLQQRLTNELQSWITANMPLSEDERPRIKNQRIAIVPAASGVNNLRHSVAPALTLLQSLAAAVLLIACANLASLLLARAMARRTEAAVRAALGASRLRLVRQYLVESLVLGGIGGLVGLLVASAGARAIVALTFAGAREVPVDPSPSGSVVAFAIGVSILTSVLFGVLPAVVASRSAPIEALRGAGRTAGDRGARLRQGLIIMQVALSLALVICAGLLAVSLGKLQTQDFGFKVNDRYVIDLAPSFSMIPADRMTATYARLRERIGQVEGVTNVGYSLYAPMSGDNWAHLVSVDGRSPADRLQASWNRVSPGYFDAIGTPVLRGRPFDERDGPGAPLVAVVSQEFARRFFGDQDPIGLRIGRRPTSGAPELDYEIVGVVGDAKYQNGRVAPYAMYYLPFLQQSETARRVNQQAGVELDRSHYAQAIELHVSHAAATLETDVRRALADVDRRLTVRRFAPMSDQIAGSFRLERLIATLTAVFGGVALLLACLGLYGVTAYAVTRRTREIGIRMAIGATRPRVLQTILSGALVQLALGIALGLPLAFLAGRLLQSQLYGVGGHDVRVMATALALLATATLAAAWIPARRAATVDPVRALRQEKPRRHTERRKDGKTERRKDGKPRFNTVQHGLLESVDGIHACRA